MNKKQIEIVSLVSDINEDYFHIIGKIACDILENDGNNALKEFARIVGEYRGREVSLATLTEYGYAYKKLKDLPLPKKDGKFTYKPTTLRKIARIKGQKKREKFAENINKKGWTEADVRFRLKYY